jgi:type I site-specific restriction endonuclease
VCRDRAPRDGLRCELTSAAADARKTLTPESVSALSHTVAGLPSELEVESEEAKRFDLLILRLQLARLRSEPGFERLRDQVKAIAGLLEEKSAIPMVRDQMAPIHDVQTDEWWQDVTLPMLESVRRRRVSVCVTGKGIPEEKGQEIRGLLSYFCH